MSTLTFLMENVIEITWIFDQLMECGIIKSWDELGDKYYDSLEVKTEIVRIATDFEKQYKNIDWDDIDLDYVIEMEQFARTELIKTFGKEN